MSYSYTECFAGHWPIRAGQTFCTNLYITRGTLSISSIWAYRLNLDDREIMYRVHSFTLIQGESTQLLSLLGSSCSLFQSNQMLSSSTRWWGERLGSVCVWGGCLLPPNCPSDFLLYPPRLLFLLPPPPLPAPPPSYSGLLSPSPFVIGEGGGRSYYPQVIGSCHSPG